MLDHPEGQTGSWNIDELIHHCEEIAEASGGLLGFHKISGEEKALLGRIQSALKGRGSVSIARPSGDLVWPLSCS